MDQNQRLAEQFEEQRPRLRSVAYRILGSSDEADDAVQEAWLRLSYRPGQVFAELGLGQTARREGNLDLARDETRRPAGCGAGTHRPGRRADTRRPA